MCFGGIRNNGGVTALVPFKGRHFDQDVIVLYVRWYLSFKLSSRDLVQMMSERGIVLAHTTILRWVQRYVPDFEKRWNHYARPVGDSWRVDETYIKVRGQWVYRYRAVDKEGRTADFLLSKRRDVAAAKRFFSRATRQHGAPRVITLDGYAASHRVVRRIESRRHLTAPGTDPVLQVLEQRHRTRPSPDQTANPADARIQAIQDGGRDDPRHRVGIKNQETTVQPQTTNQKSNHRSGNLGRGSGRLKSAK